MKRELEFRAYHVPTKRTFDVYSFCKDYVFEDLKDGFGSTPTLPANMVDCILFQYTGLKDIHRKKIFEGDIVKWGDKENTQRYAVVEFKPDIHFRVLFYRNNKTKEISKADDFVFSYSNFVYKDTENHLEIINIKL